MRSYLGVPITSPEGFNIGTLRVMDLMPRRFTQDEQETMVWLARRTIHEVEQRLIQLSCAQVMQAAPNGFVLLDEGFHVLGTNEAADQITGIPFPAGQKVTLGHCPSSTSQKPSSGTLRTPLKAVQNFKNRKNNLLSKLDWHAVAHKTMTARHSASMVHLQHHCQTIDFPFQ